MGIGRKRAIPAWGRVLWLGGRYGSAVDTGCWLGHVRRAWRGGDPSRIGNRKTEGRYFWVGRSAKLLDGGLTEVSASCCGVNLAGPAFGAGRAAKAFSKSETGGGGRYFRVGSCAKLLDVAADGGIRFLLWGEPGLGALFFARSLLATHCRLLTADR